jgi:hypothetical protein
MLKKFIEKRFSPDNENLVELIVEIADEYQAAGYTLTSRQMYYQLVARDIVENSVKSYNRIKGLITDARMAGRLDWDVIVDLGRVVHTPPSWVMPSSILRSAQSSFQLDHWDYQPVHVMVMCEKQALEGILHPAADKLSLPYVSCKGYASVSLLYKLGQQFRNKAFIDRRAVKILYFGDHDPSGLDMDRDLEERLTLFSEEGGELSVERVALTREQILQYRPPPNPAKMTDSRAKDYIKEHGRSSWELDALEPQVLVSLLQEEVDYVIDDEYGSRDIWNRSHELQEEMRSEMKGLISQSDDRKWMSETDKLYDMRYRHL